jgi:hypothetical protein
VQCSQATTANPTSCGTCLCPPALLVSLWPTHGSPTSVARAGHTHTSPVVGTCEPQQRVLIGDAACVAHLRTTHNFGDCTGGQRWARAPLSRVGNRQALQASSRLQCPTTGHTGTYSGRASTDAITRPACPHADRATKVCGLRPRALAKSQACAGHLPTPSTCTAVKPWQHVPVDGATYALCARVQLSCEDSNPQSQSSTTSEQRRHPPRAMPAPATCELDRRPRPYDPHARVKRERASVVTHALSAWICEGRCSTDCATTPPSQPLLRAWTTGECNLQMPTAYPRSALNPPTGRQHR